MDRGRLDTVSLIFLGAAFSLVCLLLAAEAININPTPALAALQRPAIFHAIVLSLYTATISSLLAALVGIPAAYALARRDFPGKGAVDVLMDLPIALSPVAVGVCLLLLFRLSPGKWIERNVISFVFEVPGIILAQFVVSLALTIRVVKAAFEEVDVRFEHVARFLGSTPWETFRRVTLPMARRGILAAFILSWARSFGEFGATVTIAGAIPGKTQTIPVAIHSRLSVVDIDGAVALMAVLTVFGLLALAGARLAGRLR